MAYHARIFAIAAVVAALPLTASCQQAEDESSEAVAEAPGHDENMVEVAAHMQLSVSEALREAMEDTFDPGQVALLETVAHQMIVAKNCDGFELDAEKAKAELTKVGSGKGETEANADAMQQKAAMALGMAMGSQIAISASDPQGFCAHAVDEKPEEGGPDEHYILTSG